MENGVDSVNLYYIYYVHDDDVLFDISLYEYILYIVYILSLIDCIMI